MKPLWRTIFVGVCALPAFALPVVSSQPVEVAKNPKATRLSISPDGKWLWSEFAHSKAALRSQQLVNLFSGQKRSVKGNESQIFSGWTANSQIVTRGPVPSSVFRESGVFPGTHWPIQVGILSPQTLESRSLWRSSSQSNIKMARDGRTIWHLKEKQRDQFDANGQFQNSVRLPNFNQTNRRAFASLSPDGNWISFRYSYDQKARLWNPKTKQSCIVFFPRGALWISDELFLQNGKTSILRRWADQKKVLEWSAKTRTKLSSDGRFLALLESGKIRWFDFQSQKVAKVVIFDHKNWRDIAFSPRRDFAFTLEHDGRILRWQI